MKKMLLIFSHKLTEIQVLDAKNNFNIEEFVYLPQNLQNLWSNIPSDLSNLSKYLQPLKDFLVKNLGKNDIYLIQGDFGAVYQMVNFAKDLGLKAVYATTKRVVEETIIDGKTVKKSIFEHRRFREYE